MTTSTASSCAEAPARVATWSKREPVSFCLGDVDGRWVHPLLTQPPYVDRRSGTAFAFSAEIDGSRSYAYPAYSVTLQPLTVASPSLAAPLSLLAP